MGIKAHCWFNLTQAQIRKFPCCNFMKICSGLFCVTCPSCYNQSHIDERANSFICEDCFKEFTISWDFEFVDGMWRDRTIFSEALDKTPSFQ